MARSTRRTSAMLGTLAIVFICIIIILCVVTKQQDYGRQEAMDGSKSATAIDVISATSTITPETTTSTITPETTTSTITPEATTTTTSTNIPEATTTTTSTNIPEATTITTSTNITETETTTTSTTTPKTITDIITSPPTTTESTFPTETTTTNDTSTNTTTPTPTLTLTPTDSPTETTKKNDTDAASTTATTTLTSTSTVTQEASTKSDSNTTTASTASTTSSTTSTTSSTASTTSSTASTTLSTASTTSSTTPNTPPLTTKRPQSKYKECNTPACMSLAKDMIAMKDSTGNFKACEDFYQYSCGDVMNKPNIKPKQLGNIARMMIKDQLDRVKPNETTGEGQMRIFYDSCLNPGSQDAKRDWIKPIKDMFGPYDFTPSALNGAAFTFDLSEALGYMMNKGFMPLFSVQLEVNKNNPKAFTMSLHPTLPGSPFSDDLARKVCLQDHHSNLSSLLSQGETSYNVTEEYDNFLKCVGTGKGLHARLDRMKDAVVRLGLMSHLNTSDQLLEQTLTNTKDFLELLSQTQKQSHVPDLVKQIANKNFYIQGTTMKDLDNNTIDWETVFSKFLNKDKSLISSYQIMMFGKENVDKIKDVLSDYDHGKAELNNILMLLWVEKVYTDFVEPVGANVGDPEYCLNTAIALMEDAASYLYLKTVTPNIKVRDEQIDKIATAIKWEGLRVLENINTTDEATKKELKKKLTDMMETVIKLNKVTEDVASESTINVNLNEDFLHNSLLLLNERNVLMMNKLGAGTHDMWRVFAHPYDPFGFYSYKLNKIMIPYAAQEPFQTLQGVPDYLHYASIGYQIGHLMWHGYDTSGSVYPSAIGTPMLSLNKKIKILYEGPRNYTNPKGLTAEYYNMTDLTTNEIWADFQATGMAWQAYVNKDKEAPTPEALHDEYIPSGEGPTRRRRSADSPQDSEELILPYLDMTPTQLYFLHWAQQFCTDSSDLRMLEVMESRQPPGRERVNFVTQHTEKFQEAFQCHPYVII